MRHNCRDRCEMIVVEKNRTLKPEGCSTQAGACAMLWLHAGAAGRRGVD
jgi:hypothetical protein